MRPPDGVAGEGPNDPVTAVRPRSRSPPTRRGSTDLQPHDEQSGGNMDREEFVKRVGVGSIGLGALAAGPAALAARPGFPKGNGHQHFTLVALGRTATPVG